MAAFYKIFIKGLVQGVGFRPYIYRKAVSRGLKGYVKNGSDGVEIVVNDVRFIKSLVDLPPLAKIVSSTILECDEQDFKEFTIIKSERGEGTTILPPDIFMCNDCLKELRKIKDRRHNYYFITCTNCGPRFSMIEDYPYDRPSTSMHDFQMCVTCKKEYTDPLDRRFHSETIACKDCGPKLILKEGMSTIKTSDDDDTVAKAASLLRAGEIVAIKGVGGFHLCSLADDVHANNVRISLKRFSKPLAIMVKDEEMLRRFAIFSKQEISLLASPQRAIIVVKKIQKDILKTASELDTVGVIFPYTALHYLLFDHLDEPLIMTSCNIQGDPVALTDEHGIGKYLLTNERRIVNRCDDSVIKVIENKEFYLRRSRGYAPLPVSLPIVAEHTLAVGAELNNSICAAKGDNCFLSQYIGNTSRYETFMFMKESVKRLVHLTRLKPNIIACDLHPGYNSTGFAQELAVEYNAKLIMIQHHKAHVASVAAEHRLKDYIGIAMDGLGYGEDGKIWGGEIFDVSDGTNFLRRASLEEQPQLGGDSATLHPKKMLFGILNRLLTEDELLKMRIFNVDESRFYIEQLKTDFNVPFTTSAGRILDAVSALLGICELREYDGRPAMLLESFAGDAKPLGFSPVLEDFDGRQILSTNALFRLLLDNIDKDKSILAATAQCYLAEGMYELAKQINKEGKKIVFSGGVAYNRMISSILIKKGVLVNKEVPAGDGGICYGQAYLANLMK